jgi:tRNA(Arg) A34 adenosine deaminase TadA
MGQDCMPPTGAIVWSRIPHVVFGATMKDHKRFIDQRGNSQWRWRVIDIPALSISEQADPPVELLGGFMREECLALFHSTN